MLICTFTWAAQNFVSVADCPKDAHKWDIRSNIKKCQGDTPNYLFAAIEKKLRFALRKCGFQKVFI